MNAYEYKDDNIKPNTITFNNNNATWVMQITLDRKIIVNEDVEVTDAAKAVFDALQGYLTPQTKPLSDEEIHELANKHLRTKDHDGAKVVLGLEDFARAIEERHGIK